MVLISYDVSTTSPAGKKRLRKVAKECQNHAGCTSPSIAATAERGINQRSEHAGRITGTAIRQ